MRATAYTTDTLQRAIEQSVRSEMEKIVAEEADAAAARVKERATAIAPRLVMALLNEFHVERYQQNIVITVRQQSGGK